jgi:hypothetical protein
VPDIVGNRQLSVGQIGSHKRTGRQGNCGTA